jgi:hypothetical protein
MPVTTLDTADADLLQFVNNWLASDYDQFRASLARFIGNPPMT